MFNRFCRTSSSNPHKLLLTDSTKKLGIDLLAQKHAPLRSVFPERDHTRATRGQLIVFEYLDEA
jgi:hypothetical protein